jgi:N-acetylmuramoyl-L-alanine amidase
VPSATLPAASATPELAGPLRVGVQVGHWKIEEMPAEQQRLRKASGSYWGGYDEWELNMMIAERVQRQLEAAGVLVDLLPATVPPGYLADAFISVHADGVTGDAAALRRGWKLAAPFRASPASAALSDAVSASYPVATGLPADTRGASFDMRAYYAFSSYRYVYAIAPATPAIIVETGFMTHPLDRALLFEETERVARGISEGVLDFLASYDRADEKSRQPTYTTMLRTTSEIALRTHADAAAGSDAVLAERQRLVPLSELRDWYLVTSYGVWDIGWVLKSDVVMTDEPLTAP